jgi:L-cysteine desulfidase
MDDIINSLQGLAISKKEYKELNLTEIFRLINIDLDNMKTQLLTDFSSITVYEFYKNINSIGIKELKLVLDYIQTYGKAVLKNKLKNTTLYYDEKDVDTIVDYYINELEDNIGLRGGC